MPRCSELRDLAIREYVPLPVELAGLVIGYAALSPADILGIILALGPIEVPVLWRTCQSDWHKLNDAFADAIRISLCEGMITVGSVTGIFNRRLTIGQFWVSVHTRLDERRVQHYHLDDLIELASKGHEDVLFDMVVGY